MKHTLKYMTVPFLLALSACGHPTAEDYVDHGDPDKMITTSSDLVTIDFASQDYYERLTDTLSQNPPDRAILNCIPDDGPCKKAKRALSSHRVPTESTGVGGSVTLVYERIAARDCDQRYVDNSRNHANLNYSALGCSVAGNIVQMVTDKHQFTNPNLLDYKDGEKTATVYDNYLNPPPPSAASGTGGAAASSLIPASSGGQ